MGACLRCGSSEPFASKKLGSLRSVSIIEITFLTFPLFFNETCLINELVPSYLDISIFHNVCSGSDKFSVHHFV